MSMPLKRKTAKREFERILREINKSFIDIYDLEEEIAWLIIKYCDPVILKRKLKGLIELE